MISRRKIAQFAPMFVALGALVACAGPGTTGGTVPTLSQVQSWVAIINSELPAFIAESEQTNLLTGATDTKVKAALVTFQALAGQFLSPTFDTKNVAVIVSEIGIALTTVLSVLPATAPYVGFIQLGVLVVSAFIASTAIPVPAIPSKEVLAGMHRDTVHFHKK